MITFLLPTTTLSMEERNNHIENHTINSTQIRTFVGSIKDAKFNTTGKLLAVIGKDDNFAEIFNTQTGELVCHLRGHTETITCIYWHPENQDLILTGSKDTTIKLWDAKTGECRATFETPRTNNLFKYKAPITSISISQGAYALLIAANEKGLTPIRIFKTQNCKQLITLNELRFTGRETNSINYTSFNELGTLVSIATNDGIVKVFARPTEFNNQNTKKPWAPKLDVPLESYEQLQAIKFYGQNYVFLVIKNNNNDKTTCLALKIDEEEPKELDFPLLDYCEKTSSMLILVGENRLLESPFTPEADTLTSRVHVLDSNHNILSAIYNYSGNQILVETSEEVHILEKKDDKWICIHKASLPSSFILHPANSNIFASYNTDSTTITLYKASDVCSFDNSHESSIQNDIEESAKRMREGSRLDKQSEPHQKKRKTDGVSIDTGNQSLEKENDVYDSNHDTHQRQIRETQTVLNLYKLIKTDRDILKKSLIDVVAEHSIDIIELYIAYKVRGTINYQDNEGKTALFHATLANKEHAVKLLITHGADVNISDSQGFSPLHIAIQKGYMSLAEYLITSGKALANQTTYTTNETPLHIAVKNKYIPAVKLLLRENPDLRILDADKKTVLTLVIESGDLDLLTLFGEKLSLD